MNDVEHLNFESDSLFSGFVSFRVDMAVVIFADVDVLLEMSVDQVILGTTYESLAAYLTVQDNSDILSHGGFSFDFVT